MASDKSNFFVSEELLNTVPSHRKNGNGELHPAPAKRMSFKDRFLKVGVWLVALFVLLFVCRLLYSYIGIDVSSEAGFFNKVEGLQKNYAIEGDDINSAHKYEKIASVQSKSSQFEPDKVQLNKAIKQFSAVIQYEKNLGLRAKRQLFINIAVPPTKFDSLMKAIDGIGIVKAKEITSVDKTNEYRRLMAKKTALIQSQASLKNVKINSDETQNFMQDKILEIQTQLQKVEVDLGDYDIGKQFCTIQFSMYEGLIEKGMTMSTRFEICTDWTLKYYGIVLLAILTFFLFTAVERFNVLKLISNKQ